MRKRQLNLLIFYFLLGLYSTNAQQISISEPLPTKPEDNFEILGQINSYSYYYSDASETFQLFRLEKDLSNLRVKELNLFERRSNLLYACIYNKMIYAVYSYRLKADLCFKLLIMDSNLDIQDSLTLSCFAKQGYTSAFKVIPTEDKSGVLLYYQFLNTYTQFYAIDFTTKTVLWQYNWNYNAEKTESQDEQKILFDNNKTATLVFNDVGARAKHTQYFKIFWLSKTGIIQNPIKIENVNIFNSDWFLDNYNNNLLLLGSYWTDTRSKAKGVLYGSLKINSSDILYYRTTEFKKDWIGPLFNEKEKAEKGVGDLKVADLVMRKDGGLVVIYEIQKELERTIPGRTINVDGIGRNIVDYFYQDMLAVSLDTLGNVEFATPMFKRQYSQDDQADYSSFLLFKSPGYLRLLYNDEIENENTISQYLLDVNGKAVRQSILNTDYRKLKLLFKYGKQIGSNSCVIPSLYRNKIKLVRMDF